jgi:hypothetical protein
MKTAIRSYLFGMHNPILHSITITIAWIRLFHTLPSFKELLCIIFHDIGYLRQTTIDGDDNKHPEFGAYLCGALLGKKYYLLCIAHSRDYAKNLNIPLSKLGYTDKASILIYPNWLFNLIIHFGGEADEYHRTTKTAKWGFPVEVQKIKNDYEKWLNENLGNRD